MADYDKMQADMDEDAKNTISARIDKPGVYAVRDEYGHVTIWSVESPGTLLVKRPVVGTWACMVGDMTACVPVSLDTSETIPFPFDDEGRPVLLASYDLPKPPGAVTEPGEYFPCGDCGKNYDPQFDPEATMLCEECRGEEVPERGER